MNLEKTAYEIGEFLMEQNKKIATAESVTGGMIASIFTSIPDCSNWFEQGCITYSNESKVVRLNVCKETLSVHGAVSKQVAIQMANGIRITSKSDIGVATTGFAGPKGGNKNNPLGTVYIGISTYKKTVVYKLCLQGNRNRIRKQAAFLALKFIEKEIAP